MEKRQPLNRPQQDGLAKTSRRGEERKHTGGSASERRTAREDRHSIAMPSGTDEPLGDGADDMQDGNTQVHEVIQRPINHITSVFSKSYGAWLTEKRRRQQLGKTGNNRYYRCLTGTIEVSKGMISNCTLTLWSTDCPIKWDSYLG